MLRHYDQMDLLKPETVDYSTGYRSYSIKQLPSLNRILFLKNLDFTLQQVKEMLEENMDVEMGVCLNKNFILKGTLPANLSVRNLAGEKKVASLIYKGPYEGTFSGVLALLNWVTLNDWNISGALREIQLSGPTHNDRGKVQTEPVTELQIPLFE